MDPVHRRETVLSAFGTVVTDGDETLALREAERLADGMWEKRGEMHSTRRTPPRRWGAGIRSDRFPGGSVFDVGDNVGGGAAADETVSLAGTPTTRRKVGWWCDRPRGSRNR